MRVEHEILTLHTRDPFVIARGAYAEHVNVLVRLIGDDGAMGLGEAAPNAYYGETPATAVEALARAAPLLADATDNLEAIEDELRARFPEARSATAALSVALHDLAGRRAGLPVHELWGLDPAEAPLSSFTIPIADESVLFERVARAEEYPILKIKLGSGSELRVLEVVRRAAPHKTLRVDANAAWSREHAALMLPVLADHGVELLEQPLAAEDLEGLGELQSRTTIPVVADESCRVSDDVARLAGVVAGINIKLAKCGGLVEAMRMVRAARAANMRVMAGCMIESSVGISGIAQLAPLLDYADLDGAALLADDPFTGVSIAGGRIEFPAAAGTGARRRDSA
ncbi:MAG TPA: dipeptide epimerase [Gemmatimonadaceae bacterium]|nr:dipeptide epimerase [Gemmatimonadaceae bacterium]